MDSLFDSLWSVLPFLVVLVLIIAIICIGIFYPCHFEHYFHFNDYCGHCGLKLNDYCLCGEIVHPMCKYCPICGSAY